jgi:hypothetical protein
MIDRKLNPGTSVTVRYAGKTLDFKLDQIPDDWETLFRDPEVEQCVHEVVMQKGRSIAEGEGSSATAIGWDEVSDCLDELRGSTG